MEEGKRDPIADLLEKWKGMGRDGLDGLFPVLYQELRRLAQSYLRSERRDHSLQATALVHEVYLRLVRERYRSATTKGQFVSIAAQAMRRILVEHARSRRARKRGGGGPVLALEEGHDVEGPEPVELLALDVLLRELDERDPRQAEIVVLRYFGGLSLQETASALGISSATVSREWHFARAWLRRELARR